MLGSEVLAVISLAVVATISPHAPYQATFDGRIFPMGVGCTPTIGISQEMGDDGKPYISAFGKQVCDKQGPGAITVVLYQGSRELGKRRIDSVETNFIIAVVAPCVVGNEPTDYLAIAQFNDDYVGQTIQHKKLVGSQCRVP